MVVDQSVTQRFVIKICRGGRKNAGRRGGDPRYKSIAEERKDMKREFLQNLKAGNEALSKEVIDAIMAENGRDIENAKAAFADYDAIKDQLTQARETIKGYEALDIEGIRKAAQAWEEKYNQSVAEHQKQLAQL